MHIRRAKENDAEQIAQAQYETAAAEEGLLAARPYEIPVSAFRDKIKQLGASGLYVVAESQGQLVGHLILEPLGLAAIRHVVQLTLVVHPGHTGQGYGKALMNYAIDWARESEEVEKIELRVRSTNARAIGLYESLGFVREGRFKKRIKLQRGYADDICMALFVDGA